MRPPPEYYRRHLPHWQPKGAIFFVTFRLNGSLPVEVIQALREQREREKSDLLKLLPHQRHQQNDLDEQLSFERWDALLDKAGFGPRWLGKVEIAEIVKEAFHYHTGRDFELFAYSIMSNHVHAVFEPLGSEYHSNQLPLSKIMQSFKRYTARAPNLLLGRQGAFWQDESYDHVIRNEAEFQRVVYYVLENPVKAGLVTDWEAWPWSYLKVD
jgi:putative transposase